MKFYCPECSTKFQPPDEMKIMRGTLVASKLPVNVYVCKSCSKMWESRDGKIILYDIDSKM